MAVTVNQQPAAYSMANTPLVFQATSTQIAAANFTYTVICTDLITSATETYQIEQRPVTGELVFYAHNFVKDYIKHFVPKNQYGFKVCTDAVRKIRVNIGETYGSTPTYYAGSNIDITVWNGAIDHLGYISYAQADYLYTNSVPFKYLQSGTAESGYYYPRHTTYSDKSLFLYVLADITNTLETLRVKTYDSAGTLLGTSDIANVYYNNATYTNKYFCIDVGHKGLSQISAGDVTGTYPIITSSVAYYILYDVNTSAGTPPSGTVEPIRRIDIGCEAKHDVYSLVFLDKKGDFNVIPFNKKSELKVNNKKTTYKQMPYTMASNTWAYSSTTPNERVLDTSSTRSLSLNSDWMDANQIEAFSHVINSSVCYLDYGSTIGLIPVVVRTNSMVIAKKWNSKMKNISIDVDFTYSDTWQND